MKRNRIAFYLGGELNMVSHDFHPLHLPLGHTFGSDFCVRFILFGWLIRVFSSPLRHVGAPTIGNPLGNCGSSLDELQHQLVSAADLKMLIHFIQRCERNGQSPTLFKYAVSLRQGTFHLLDLQVVEGLYNTHLSSFSRNWIAIPPMLMPHKRNNEEVGNVCAQLASVRKIIGYL